MAGRPRVLVLDDNPGELHTLADKLVLHGYEVMTAQSVKEAAHHLKTGFNPDIFLLDRVVHGRPIGEEFGIRLRGNRHYKDRCIVLLTSEVERPEVPKGEFDLVLQKPVGAQQLATVQRLLPVR